VFLASWRFKKPSTATPKKLCVSASLR